MIVRYFLFFFGETEENLLLHARISLSERDARPKIVRKTAIFLSRYIPLTLPEKLYTISKKTRTRSFTNIPKREKIFPASQTIFLEIFFLFSIVHFSLMKISASFAVAMIKIENFFLFFHVHKVFYLPCHKKDLI